MTFKAQADQGIRLKGSCVVASWPGVMGTNRGGAASLAYPVTQADYLLDETRTGFLRGLHPFLFFTILYWRLSKSSSYLNHSIYPGIHLPGSLPHGNKSFLRQPHSTLHNPSYPLSVSHLLTIPLKLLTLRLLISIYKSADHVTP